LLEKDQENGPPGFPGLETALPLLLTAVHDGYLSLDQLIEKMHTNPRRIFGLPEQPNTFVEVDLDHAWKIPEAMPYSKCQWTPFANKHVVGKVLRVVIRGETAFLDGKGVLANPGFGQNIVKAARRTAPAPGTAVSVVTGASAGTLKTRGTKSYEEIPASSGGNVVTPTSPSPGSIIRGGAIVPSAAAEKIARFEGNFHGRNILSVEQFTRDDLHILFSLATEMKFIVRTQGSIDLLKGKVLATLFAEPSTRTHLSFVAAMQRLGGTVITFNEHHSSMKKGESLEDTIKTLECYADGIVIRHPEAGTAKLAAKVSHKPVINAGDGTGEHPTQVIIFYS
jgi:carbamoyl-phosphate synthase/aspartate carbamoyltransferase/dihydroorotase